MSDMETKAFTAELKASDDEQGIAVVRFATMGEMDLDGDITEPGAFGEQRVKVSAYGHTSWGGALPVGVGTIKESGDEAIATLQFFMSTDHGRNHYETVKGLGSLGEWSYGFDVTDEAEPDEEQAKAGVKRILKKLTVHEVSPVLRGAGVGTRTLAVKCDSCDAKESDTEPVPEPESKPEDERLREEFAYEFGRYEMAKRAQGL